MSEPKESIHPNDRLKILEQVTVVDPRNSHIELTMWHTRIAQIELTQITPKPVRQLFENVKNIALYAYFAYRLHQPAEVVGYSALEKALKMKYDQEKDSTTVRKTPKTLENYMNIALEEGWITGEGYESSHHLAASRVQHKKSIR